MPGKTTALQRPVTEKTEEIKAKIALLEGDRKAYYETSEFAKSKNKENIAELRRETKELRKKLSDAKSKDDHVIGQAFQEKPAERASMKNKSGRQAITIMDYKVCDTIKRLNALRHQTALKQKKLEEVQQEYDEMVKEASDAVATDKGESAEAQTMRYLENSYDKYKMKNDEARHLNRIYLEIKDKLEKDGERYPNALDAMELEIQKCREELKELKSMHNDAHISKESAQSDLRRHEEVVYSDRKKREIELQKMKKEADEKKMQHERIEKRIAQRGSIQQDEMTPQDKQALTGEEHQQKITSYEEVFRTIKDATGVSDTAEVVHRFENQGETTEHLETLKKDNEKQITRLKEEKEKMQDEFGEMKYSGEAKLSSGQRMLEEFETDCVKDENRRKDAEDKFQRSSRIMVSVKAGVEHLGDKLHHLKSTKGHVPMAQISPSSDDYVLDQLSTCEEKLLKLLEELDGKDLKQTMREMEEEEFHASVEGKLPQYNTRIKLPQTQRDNVYDEDDSMSGGEDGDVLTRNAIKKQSNYIVESKTKRRIPRKKKKAK